MLSITPKILKQRRQKAIQEILKSVESMINLRNEKGYTHYDMESTDTTQEVVDYMAEELKKAGFTVSLVKGDLVRYKLCIRWD